MNKKLVGYWVTTALFCLVMTADGVASLLRIEQQQAIMEVLGYPPYLMTLLGILKLLGSRRSSRTWFRASQGVGLRWIQFRPHWSRVLVCRGGRSNPGGHRSSLTHPGRGSCVLRPATRVAAALTTVSALASTPSSR